MFKMVLALPFASVVADEDVSVPDPTVRRKLTCCPAAVLPSPFNALTPSVNDTVLPDATNLDRFTAASTSPAELPRIVVCTLAPLLSDAVTTFIPANFTVKVDAASPASSDITEQLLAPQGESREVVGTEKVTATAGSGVTPSLPSTRTRTGMAASAPSGVAGVLPESRTIWLPLSAPYCKAAVMVTVMPVAGSSRVRSCGPSAR